MAVAGSVRGVARRADGLLPSQLFVDSLLGQAEDLADAIVETLGIVDQGRVEFDFQVDARTAGAIAVVGDLTRNADIGFEWHVSFSVVGEVCFCPGDVLPTSDRRCVPDLVVEV